MRNLIENAVKYGGANKPVGITASANGEWITVRVNDQGPGIAPEEVGRVFDSFYRAGQGQTLQVKGAGLGLAISRGFVRAHGGDVWIEPSDEGLCVAFSLPVAERRLGLYDE